MWLDVFAKIAFLDLEASSLEPDISFPTEVGWAFLERDGMRSGARLIKPPPAWLVPKAWNEVSADITGITLDMLEAEGIDPATAFKEFRDATGDRMLLSDNPGFDFEWLSFLARAAHAPPPDVYPTLEVYRRLLNNLRLGHIDAIEINDEALRLTPNQHRAEPDAQRWAHRFALLAARGAKRRP